MILFVDTNTGILFLGNWKFVEWIRLKSRAIRKIKVKSNVRNN